MVFLRKAVLVAGFVLLLNASAAAAEVVVLVCRVATPLVVVDSCDKSSGVSAACPSTGASCAQALATYQSSPDKLRLRTVEEVPSSTLTNYTLTSAGGD